MFKIIVSSEEEKQQLLAASVHIHDVDINTDLPMVNTLAHLYQAPHLIEVMPEEYNVITKLTQELVLRINIKGVEEPEWTLPSDDNFPVHAKLAKYQNTEFSEVFFVDMRMVGDEDGLVVNKADIKQLALELLALHDSMKE